MGDWARRGVGSAPPQREHPQSRDDEQKRDSEQSELEHLDASH
jgi:hypothetical protein